MLQKTLAVGFVLTTTMLLYTTAPDRPVEDQDHVNAHVVNLDRPHPIEGTIAVVDTIQHAIGLIYLSGIFLPQHLDGNVPVQFQILGLVDLIHAATAE